MIRHLEVAQLETGVEKAFAEIVKKHKGHPVVFLVLDGTKVNLEKATDTMAKIQGAANVLIAGLMRKK